MRYLALWKGKGVKSVIGSRKQRITTASLFPCCHHVDSLCITPTPPWLLNPNYLLPHLTNTVKASGPNEHLDHLQMLTSKHQRWNITKYFYSSTVLVHNFEVLVAVFPFCATFYFYSTNRKILQVYFLLQYIYMTFVVTNSFSY